MAFKKMLALREIDSLRSENMITNLRIPMYAVSTCVIVDADAYIKNSLTYGMSVNVIQTMGTRRHNSFVEQALNEEVSID